MSLNAGRDKLVDSLKPLVNHPLSAEKIAQMIVDSYERGRQDQNLNILDTLTHLNRGGVVLYSYEVLKQVLTKGDNF